MPLKGMRLIFCPKNSIFSGVTIELVSCGVLNIASSSRYVVKSHDSTILFKMENVSGG